jgi:hypothetical protein
MSAEPISICTEAGLGVSQTHDKQLTLAAGAGSTGGTVAPALTRRSLPATFAGRAGTTKEDLMPAGGRSQIWFPELVAELRHAWRPDLTWEAVIHLRDQLQRGLEHILRSRGIKPATVRCVHCGHVGPGASPAISVRSLLLALRRFGIEAEARVRQLDREWSRHRALLRLDRYGRAPGSGAAALHRHSEGPV